MHFGNVRVGPTDGSGLGERCATPGRGLGPRQHQQRHSSAGGGQPGVRRRGSLPLDARPAPRPAGPQAGRRRVVNIADKAEPAPADPHPDTTVGIGRQIRQRIQVVLLDGPGVGNLGADPAVVTLERDLLGPTVVLGLEICDRVEGAQWEE